MQCLVHRFKLVHRSLSYEYYCCPECGLRRYEVYRPDRFDILDEEWLSGDRLNFKKHIEVT